MWCDHCGEALSEHHDDDAEPEPVPRRKPGRPKTDDPRTMRVKMSGAEWAHCVEAAKKAGAKSTAAWVRERCGL